MTILDSILRTEVIAGIIIISGFAMCIRSILAFTNQATELRPKLTKIESQLGNLCDSIEGRKVRVADLSEVVFPLKDREARMRSYYDQMIKQELDKEKEQMAAQADKESKRTRRIQRKKMGYDDEGEEEEV
jgi:hypothetical protein